MKLRIKVESNGNSFNYKEELAEDYIIAKENMELQTLVQKCCEDSHFDEIQDVTLYAQLDW